MSKIIIFCDGGCRNNQGDNNIGGWGTLLTHDNHEVELYGGDRNTTNNKMEITACIKALEYIESNKSIPVELHCDSSYVVDTFNEGWINGWIARGWRKSDKKPVKNKELWMRLHSLYQSMDSVKFVKVKGHSDNEGNNKADALANKAMDELI